ncbi:MAG: ParB N-terminal domain-containing protein [Candidatus Acidiferrum sp.]
MNITLIKVRLTDLMPAPWRFSEDLARAHQKTRHYSPIQRNIVRSLQTDGQFAPIQVRPVGNGKFEIVDGHIVADAARELGWAELDAISHELTDDEARLRYIHINLNRCGQYGHYHVKIHRVFGKVPADSNEQKANLIHQHVSWPADRVLDYVELSEKDENWMLFAVPRKAGEEEQMDFFNEIPEVPDHQ